MSLSTSFTATQSIGVLSNVTFVDSSTGTNTEGITQRRIFVQLPDGTYLVEEGTTTDYETWLYADSSITLSILTKSQAAKVVVQWLAGTTVIYTSTVYYCFNLYDYVFLYGLTQTQVSNPTIISDTNYYWNKLKMITNLDSAEQAIALANDFYSSQLCLNMNYQMMQHQAVYF